MYINKLEIQNLPHDESNWKVGDTIDVDGKNTLFKGDNGTGKSTMLNILHYSLTRARKVMH